MPNKENLRKWVEALRSGRYEQGHGHMRKDGRYCCLGVAMEVALDNGVTCVPNWGTTSLLPSAVNNWYGTTGLSGLNERLGGPDDMGVPSDLNDSGRTFVEIADGIEATYKLLED
jgi:hypothetical protein